ncbi:Na+/H+ antiporter NhaC family protein [Faecalibacterium prausnitzii]|uniref:Na+/H+ antiporter NhaC family protein n=1 Tax=Faecalibacterium prausnitzii TaxID=853 RepID=UPI0022DF961B|nr:Na+/H+ antiporter NhaC family protein [Faecalibacterium prausnitzii]
MKNKNLSWVGALFVFALLLWCTAVTPGKVADPATYTCAVYSTFFSLLPPVIAIVLALNTKEVYTSLLVGIASGALLYANGNLELALNTLFFNEDGGMITKLSDSGNVGILAFLVMLGILVALMNKAGGSAAFGRWASTHIHSRAGAQFATLLLGVMIFVDDYFNCLTVGSVMRPVTDRQKVSRAKLAYLIDSTAAPICIIAPVSSWAAAVTSSVPEGSGINGFTMFLRTIPYNYYAVMTVVMSLFLIFTGAEFGPMKLNEDNAKNGDLFTTTDRPYGDDVDDGSDTNGHVIDLLAPVLVLIAACIFGMVYTGGFFEGVDFITAFADCNASAGLVLGSSIALLFTFVFYRVRSVMTFQDFAACIPEGFKAMVSPMLILSLAWTLSGMTGLLGAKYYVANLLGNSAAALQYLLPFIIFLVAVFLAFATGTSWGTFSILIPIVCHAFPNGEMLVVSIAACLSGAVCGDHCSPISDTTIMASAGAHCSHVNHVSTQLPYAITAAACSAVCYIITGLAQAVLGSRASLVTSLVLLVVAIVLELAVLSVIRARTRAKTSGDAV